MKESKDQSAVSTQTPAPFSRKSHRALGLPPRSICLRLRYPLPARAAAERGAALITMMLVGVLATGLLSMAWLESLDRERHLRRHHEYSLSVAKDALLGSSASYPDTRPSTTKDIKGPGRLPCSDTGGNGSGDSSDCEITANFPWRQLGLIPQSGANEARIGYFWYAVDDGFSADGSNKKVNMNTEPDTRIDDREDVVAVIIAPGAPLAFQNRSRSGWAIDNYLEAENATSGDGVFTYGGVGFPDPLGFNDRPAVVTRDELMDVVSLRVLAAVRSYLEQYRNADWNEERALPWLKPTSDRDEGAMASVGTRRGWLPIFGDGSEFKSDFSLVGSLEGGTIKGSVDAAALVFPKSGLSVEEGTCTWESLNEVKCEGTATTRPQGGGVRVYTININLQGDASVIAPSASDIRRREVQGARWASESTIEIAEHSEEPATDENRTRQGSIEFPESTEDDLIDEEGNSTLSLRGIAFPPSAIEEDPDDQRLPYWLLDNDWHRLLWVEIASPFVAGGSGDCLEGDCLSLTRVHLDGRSEGNDQVAVALLLPGRMIASGERDMENFDSSQWFEGENKNTENGHYEMRLRTPGFNDYIDALFSDELEER